MLYKRPVAETFKISAPYGKWGPLWDKHKDSNGKWIIGQIDGQGMHKGVDFAVPEGTEVHAMADGLIVAAGWENADNSFQGFGQRIRQQIVTDSGLFRTMVYGHLSLIYVKPGDQVCAGDRIALSGKTGHVSGPHLHVELVDTNVQYYSLDFS